MRYLFIPSCEVAPVDVLQGTFTEKRLMKGLEIWKKGRFDFIIVPGGVHLPPNTQTRPVGKLMAEWLIGRGVPDNKIICENDSRDTYENIFNSLDLIEGDKDPKITVVSHWQHTLRIWVTFWIVYEIKVKIKPMFYRVGLKTFLLEWYLLTFHVFDPKGESEVVKANRLKRTFNKKGG